MMMSSIFQVITLVWSLSGGQYLTNATVYDEYFSSNSNFFVETSFEFQLPFNLVKGGEDMFFIGSSTENQFMKSDITWGMIPRQDTFIFSTGVRFLGFELGFNHMCLHPVNDFNTDSYVFFSGYDKVYLKIDGKI